MKKVPLTQRKFALVDDEDFHLVAQYKWCAVKYRSGTFYAMRNIKLSDTKRGMIGMHRFLLNTAGTLVVDHIDGDGLNNQRNNLRLATHKQNLRNSKIFKNNTSGFKGVWYRKDRDTYAAEIRVDYKKICLGCFKNIKDAAKAYNSAAVKHFGKFAKLNEIKED